MDNYSYVVGFKGKSTLLYLHDDKNLFVRKSNAGNNIQYECYHNVTNNENYRRCSVYCTVKEDVVKRNFERHCHTDHSIKYKDLVSLNAMRQTCTFLKEHCPSSAHRIPLYDIFLNEISK